MDFTRPPVQQAVIACPNSWKAITSIWILRSALSQGKGGGEMYLEGPQRVSYIGDIPQQRNDYHVEDNYTQCDPLGVVHRQSAAEN